MVQNPKGGGLSSTIGGSQMVVYKKTTDFRHLDISNYNINSIILLSSFFTGTLSDTDSKSLKTQEVQHSQTRQLQLLKTHLLPQIQQNKLLLTYSKCQPVKAGIL
jgi:preprotein translocase subunit SecG